MNLFKKILKWVGLTILVLFVGVVVYRGFVIYEQRKTVVVVEKIHNTKITLDDVMGKNLPPAPGDKADVTVAGVDVNKNGIRDDVELAIFEKYPDSAKKRAVSLQYALALQMEFAQPFLNTDIVIAVAQEKGRSYECVGEIFNRKNMDIFIKNTEEITLFIKDLHLSTDNRKIFQEEFYKKIDSYSSLPRICDIDYTKLSN